MNYVDWLFLDCLICYDKSKKDHTDRSEENKFDLCDSCKENIQNLKSGSIPIYHEFQILSKKER